MSACLCLPDSVIDVNNTNTFKNKLDKLCVNVFKCNTLPDIVVTAPSLNIFKNRLDKHWINQDVLYVWHAEISGTGSRSNIS